MRGEVCLRVGSAPQPNRPWETTGYGLGLMIGQMTSAGAAFGHSGAGPGNVSAVYHFSDLTTPRTVALGFDGRPIWVRRKGELLLRAHGVQGVSVTGSGQGRRVRLHRALQKSETPPLDDRNISPMGLEREAGLANAGVNRTGCSSDIEPQSGRKLLEIVGACN